MMHGVRRWFTAVGVQISRPQGGCDRRMFDMQGVQHFCQSPQAAHAMPHHGQLLRGRTRWEWGDDRPASLCDVR